MQMSHTEMLAMVKAMNKYGGSFVCGLADCFLRADGDNLKRLYKAFPEYVAKYREIAEHDAQQSVQATIATSPKVV